MWHSYELEPRLKVTFWAGSTSLALFSNFHLNGSNHDLNDRCFEFTNFECQLLRGFLLKSFLLLILARDKFLISILGSWWLTPAGLPPWKPLILGMPIEIVSEQRAIIKTIKRFILKYYFLFVWKYFKIFYWTWWKWRVFIQTNETELFIYVKKMQIRLKKMQKCTLLFNHKMWLNCSFTVT